MTIHEATKGYESWLNGQIPLIRKMDQVRNQLLDFISGAARERNRARARNAENRQELSAIYALLLWFVGHRSS